MTPDLATIVEGPVLVVADEPERVLAGAGLGDADVVVLGPDALARRSLSGDELLVVGGRSGLAAMELLARTGDATLGVLVDVARLPDPMSSAAVDRYGYLGVGRLGRLVVLRLTTATGPRLSAEALGVARAIAALAEDAAADPAPAADLESRLARSLERTEAQRSRARRLRRRLDRTRRELTQLRRRVRRSRRREQAFARSGGGRLVATVERIVRAAQRRRALSAAALAVAALVVVAAVLVAAGTDRLLDAVVLVLLLVVAVLATLGLSSARAVGARLDQGRRDDAEHLERARRRDERDAEALIGRLERLESGLDVVRERTDLLVTAWVPDAADSLGDDPDVDDAAPLERDEIVRMLALQRAESQAVGNLLALVPVRAAVPPMGGWAASAALVLQVVDDLLEHRPQTVVECGSGVSTLWLALAAREHDLPTRIVALEHDERFAAGTRELLARHGVADRAEVRVAALAPTSLPGHDAPWYDAAATDDLEDVGLLLVDGPPAATGRHARYPAVPLLRDRFAPAVSVYLDDLVREDEQEVLRAWQDELTGFARRDFAFLSGAARLRRDPGDGRPASG